jgi:hypothetical protein
MDIDVHLDATEEGVSQEPRAIPALPGINVVPKEKAKRYENSVR